MMKEFKSTITKLIQEKYDPSFTFSDCELDEAIEQTMIHLFANNLIFLKDVRHEEFVECIWQYIVLKRKVK